MKISQISQSALFGVLLISELLYGVSAYAAATLPTLPTSLVDVSYSVPTGTSCTATNSAQFTTCLNSAALNSTIVLTAGTTYTAPAGGFVLPNKTTGSGWIYIVSSNLAGIPVDGTRATASHASAMPKITATAGNETAIQAAIGAHHYRFVGIEFSPAAGQFNYSIVSIGSSNTVNIDAANEIPHHIIFDRCYVHGSSIGARRGIQLDANHGAVINSTISGIYDDGSGTGSGPADSQAIWAFNAYGPFLIQNNYLESGGENVMFGGNDSPINGLNPSDITIRGNHFFKPIAWYSTNPERQMKNLLEFKQGVRALVEGNVFENNLAGAQNGFSILLTPRNQGGSSSWSAVQDITIRFNRLKGSVAQGINILGRDNEAGTSQETDRIHIHDNEIRVTGGGMFFQQVSEGQNISVIHNTFVGDGTPGFLQSPSPKIDQFDFRSNITLDNGNGFLGDGTSAGISTLNTHTTNYRFDYNAIVQYAGGTYPVNNFYPGNIAAVGFTNYAGGNYQLTAGSAYHNAGHDGLDLGADYTLLNAAIANTITGAGGSSDTTAPAAPTGLGVQ